MRLIGCEPTGRHIQRRRLGAWTGLAFALPLRWPALVPLTGLILWLHAADDLALRSPDGAIGVRLPAPGALADGRRPEFEVRFRGRMLLQGELGLSIGGRDLLEHAAVESGPIRTFDTNYAVAFGKSNPVRDHYSECALEVQTRAGPIGKLHLVFRAYDDGVAFRYAIPRQEGVESIEVTGEPFRLRLAGDPRTWPLYRESYTTSHEGLYAATRFWALATNQLIDLPLLFQHEDGTSLAITEANLRGYAGLYLKADGDMARGERWLRGDLSPLPGQRDANVRARLPLVSPWRVLLIGDQPGRLIESNLILNLNEPSDGDFSWLRLGKATWYWWNGPYQEPVGFRIGWNWRTMKHYIDFCARNRIAFHSLMSTPDEFPWYHQSQRGYGPGPDTDITRPREGVSMERVGDYARSKGVGLRLWVHWQPLSAHLEAAFAQYEKWGVAGLMVDFLDRDDQEMVEFAERVLQSAARHRLHIQFHGVWKPTGLQRTYPNLLNHEGVLNLEYLKWSDQCGPGHNVTVPFTRMLAGPMDYHLGGFRATDLGHFTARNMKPSVLGTRAHHLAMYVVFENPMPMVADAPTAYAGQPGFDFIRQVPTRWDETRVLSGDVGHSIVVARRLGADWYMGAMTDWTPRRLEIPLRFLGPGRRFRIETWADAPASADPNRIVHQRRTVDAGATLVLQLNGGGGQVARIRALSFRDQGAERPSPLRAPRRRP